VVPDSDERDGPGRVDFYGDSPDGDGEGGGFGDGAHFGNCDGDGQGDSRTGAEGDDAHADYNGPYWGAFSCLFNPVPDHFNAVVIYTRIFAERKASPC